MNKRPTAITGRRSDDLFGLNGVRLGKQIRHKTRGTDKGKRNSSSPDGGLAFFMPGSDGKTLLDVQRRKLDDPAYSFLFGQHRGCLVSPRNLGTDIDEINRSCALDGAPHIHKVDEVMQRRMAERAEATLEELIATLVDGIIEAHTVDPELSDLLNAEVPHRADGTRDFSIRLHGAFRTALAAHAKEFGGRIDLDMRPFFVSNMVDALGHAIVLRRPAGSSLSRARAELVRAILAYLRH
jgi:hypothetical protein